MKKIKLLLVLLITLTLGSMSTYAAGGLRYASVQYEINNVTADEFTVTFRVEEIWDAGAAKVFTATAITTPPQMINMATIRFRGADPSGNSNLLLGYVENTPQGYKKLVGEITHTYPIEAGVISNISNYIVDVESQRRSNTVLGFNANITYRLRLRVVYPFNGYKSPAINLGTPITIVRDPLNLSGTIDVAKAVLFDKTADATTPNSVTYELSDASSSGLLNAPTPATNTVPGTTDRFAAYSLLAADNLPARRGDIAYTLNANTDLGDYATQIRVTDIYGGEAVVDFIITVVDCYAPAPTVAVTENSPLANQPRNSGYPFVVAPGTTIDFDVLTNSTSANYPTISTSGLPLSANFVRTSPVSDGNGNYEVTGNFNWTPTVNDIGLNSIDFTAQNVENPNNNPLVPVCPKTTSFSILIEVVKDIPEVNPSIRDLCSDDPTEQNWEIFNPESFTFPIIYQVLGANPPQTATVGIVPGSNVITTTTIPGPNILEIAWVDNRGARIDFLEWNAGPCTGCITSDDEVEIQDVSTGQACGSLPLTYYDGLSSPIELSAVAIAGLTYPYTYLWSTGETSQNIFVSPTVNSTYTVVITDANGCFATATAEVIYCDARAYDKKGNVDAKKVTICHYPPGNPGNVQTITISINALCTHITQHGDQIGDCNCGTSNKTDNPIDYTEVTALSVYPNPSAGHFNIEYNLPEAGDVKIVMTDLTGRIVYQESFDGAAGIYEHGLSLQGNAPGVYLLKVTLNADEYTVKVNITK